MKPVLATRELTPEGPRRSASSATARRGKRSVTVNLAESPLGWLFAHGRLTRRQFDAGERLRGDWERAQLAPSVTMSWSPVRIAGSGDQGLTAGERQLAAKTRFTAAVDHAGPGLSDILWRVVCAGEALPAAEKGLAWPARSGKLVLGLALDRIADFYRIG